MHETLFLQALGIPLLAGFVCWLCGRRLRQLSVWVALAGAVWALVAAWMIYDRPGASLDWPWFQVGELGLGLAFRTTGLGRLVGLLASCFSVLLVVYSAGYLKGDFPVSRHCAYIMWTLAGALTALYADNLLLLLIGWEVVTLMLYLLANLGDTEDAAAGAMKSFVMVGFGDCAMLAGAALLWATGAMPKLLISGVPAGGLQVGPQVGYAPYLLILCGALAKAGSMPLHSWLPDMARGAPSNVMAFLPACLDKLLGIYLLVVLSFRVFVIDEIMQILLLIIGSLTVLCGVMMAMAQHDLKKLLAYHAVSQVGYMVLGIGTGLWIGVVGALFHMLNNAVYKSCLFMSAGAVERRAGTTDLDRLGGLGRRMPVTFLVTVVAAMSISGVPLFSGFVSKWMIYQGLLASKLRLAPLALVVAVFGSVLTLASFVKVLHSVFLGPMSAFASERDPRDPGPRMLAPMVVLAVVCVLFGLWYALPTQALIGPAVAASGIGLTPERIPGYWQPLPALGLVALGLLGGVAVYLIGGGFRVRRVPTFTCGESLPSEPIRVSGTSFYGTVRDLPILKGLYADAERKAWDVYRLGGGLGGSLVRVLRAFHTGVLPLYVSWCLLGLIVLIAFLARSG